MEKQKTKAFTLVELIIVITILAILATLAFISFQGYTSGAKDTGKITSLKTIEQGLMGYKESTGIYPYPDNALDIVGVNYQGYVGENVARQIKMGKNNSSSGDANMYIYSVGKDRLKYELGVYLEDKNSSYFSALLPKVYAANSNYIKQSLYTLGDLVGIFVDGNTHTPVQEIYTGSLNFLTNTGTFIVQFGNTSSSGNIITGSGQSFLNQISQKQSSCILGNSVISNGNTILSYATTSVDYNQTCQGIQRTCKNGVLDGDTNYKYDVCTSANALNCNATTQNGYTVPSLNHGQNQNITKTISNGTATMNVSCSNGVLSFGSENITCSQYALFQGGNCISLGGDTTNPGISCKDIKTKIPSSADGLYWIKPDTNPSFQVYCDMTTDGGGWTLVAGVNNSANWAYNSAYYTNDSVFGTPGLFQDYKVLGFSTLPGTQLGVFVSNGASVNFAKTAISNATWKQVFLKTTSITVSNLTSAWKNFYNNCGGRLRSEGIEGNLGGYYYMLGYAPDWVNETDSRAECVGGLGIVANESGHPFHGSLSSGWIKGRTDTGARPLKVNLGIR